ncbi:uncharacterized protein BO96DRAFT_351876 [Aspergillus niger CBS 101883]|uniref:Contig An12c0160, genomic contig n=2 Tax=Aspergillus niger TaxID=5061 RepID=A2QZL0_ASPNC|nr:uncharacterized protein BO96DRAFT_351876 [Aspergillus niger CBS 101883]XP_059604463.1 uncharacterized protein An12g05290 [Aspergillus niger]PYH50698.1 hypothetical protein BO96DRAFT_351876 [Aspergillus niger CBS 101883]CAK46242.1 unnamed protein product [Aspergillus niger]
MVVFNLKSLVSFLVSDILGIVADNAHMVMNHAGCAATSMADQPHVEKSCILLAEWMLKIEPIHDIYTSSESLLQSLTRSSWGWQNDNPGRLTGSGVEIYQVQDDIRNSSSVRTATQVLVTFSVRMPGTESMVLFPSPSLSPSSWAHAETQTNWLKDLLPERIPYTRILAFCYNANILFGASSAGIKEQAENLLLCLSKERKVRE